MTKAHPETRIGHVHLKVSDLKRSTAFYRDVMGLEVMLNYGDQAAFLSAGGYHHHIGLNTWESKDGTPADKRHPGLYHTAFVYPDRVALAAALKRVTEAGVTITGSADHGVSEAVYFDDPDGNGIEIYWDRDRADWPRDGEGELVMSNTRLDLAALLAEAD